VFHHFNKNSKTNRRQSLASASKPIEALEPRRLFAAVALSEGATTTEFTNYAYYGHQLFGDNGDEGGIPTLVIGTPNDNSVGYLTWDPNYLNGIDSGDLWFELTVDVSGTSDVLTLENYTAEDLTWSGSGVSTISSVKVRAGVLGGQLASSLAETRVKFFAGGTLVDTSDFFALDVDLMNDTSSNPYEKIATVTTTHTNIDKVIIEGVYRLQSNMGWAGSNDVFSDFFIYA